MNGDVERLSRVRMIADYQFGKGTGKELFPDGSTFQLSRTKRVRQVFSSVITSYSIHYTKLYDRRAASASSIASLIAALRFPLFLSRKGCNFRRYSSSIETFLRIKAYPCFIKSVFSTNSLIVQTNNELEDYRQVYKIGAYI